MKTIEDVPGKFCKTCNGTGLIVDLNERSVTVCLEQIHERNNFSAAFDHGSKVNLDFLPSEVRKNLTSIIQRSNSMSNLIPVVHCTDPDLLNAAIENTSCRVIKLFDEIWKEIPFAQLTTGDVFIKTTKDVSVADANILYALGPCMIAVDEKKFQIEATRIEHPFQGKSNQMVSLETDPDDNYPV